QSFHAALEDQYAALPHCRKECADTRIQVCGIFRGRALRKTAQGTTPIAIQEVQVNQRFITGAILTLLIAVFLMSSPASGQLKLGTNAINVAPATAKPWTVTKTPDGQPDLQGYWTNNTMTPLQRPKGVTKEFYTKEEFLEALKKQAE